MKNAHEWVDQIMDSLFLPDKRRMETMVTDLNRANGNLRNEKTFGFMHHGSRYLDPRYEGQAKQLAKFPMPTLSLELADKAKQFDAALAQLILDRDQIKQAITPLIINCNSLQDIRDSLPECLIHLVPEVSDLPRTKEDNTVFIRSDKYAMRAYEKALVLIQAYSVAALFC